MRSRVHFAYCISSFEPGSPARDTHGGRRVPDTYEVARSFAPAILTDPMRAQPGLPRLRKSGPSLHLPCATHTRMGKPFGRRLLTGLSSPSITVHHIEWRTA